MRSSLLISLFALVGCVSWFRPHTSGAPWAASYTQAHPECNEHRTDDDPAQWVLTVMCAPGGFTGMPLPRLAIDPDPATAAGNVVHCAAHDCDPDSGGVQWPLVAAMWDLAMRIDARAVDDELAKAHVADDLRAAFVARYRAAQARLRAIVDAQGKHWREVFLTPALDARARRAAEDAALASWKDKVDAYVHDTEADAMRGEHDDAWWTHAIDRALALRRTYVPACLPVRHDLGSCLRDPIAEALRRVIRRLADERDPALVAADAALDAFRSHVDPRNEEWLAADDAIGAEDARFKAYRDLKTAGDVSADVIAERFPVPPIALGDDVFAAIGAKPVDTDHAPYVSAGAPDEMAEEQVRAIERHGARATLLFRKNVWKDSYQTDCYETDRVDSISPDGTVNYRERCTGPVKTDVEDNTLKPVDVPWIEVAHVKAGEIAHVVVDAKTRRGHVAWVGEAPPKGSPLVRETPPVQLREWRLPVH